jgi:DNA end-binding protein Ku
LCKVSLPAEEKMASRAVWKGQLRLSLVSIPVEMHSATESGAKVSFRQIHEPTGKPVKYEKVVRGLGPVDTSEIVKGYEYENDKYVLLDPKEVDAIKLETKKTLELVQFVGACEIPPLYFDKPYYLVPTDELAEDAYRVVRDALRQSEKVGIGQVTLRGKEYLAAVKPCGDGLLLETLHYEEEIRRSDPLFSDIGDEKVDDDLLSVARQLIERKTAPFDAAAYQDRYATALKELLDAKLSSRSTKRVSTGAEPSEPAAENVIDLMAALKASLDKSGGKPPAKSGAKSPGAKSSANSAAKPAGRSAKKPAASASEAKKPAPRARKKAS